MAAEHDGEEGLEKHKIINDMDSNFSVSKQNIP